MRHASLILSYYREKSKVEFSFGFFGQKLDFNTLQTPVKAGNEYDTLDGAPDLIDEEVLQEVQDVSCQETDIDNEKASEQKGILIQFVPNF